MTGSLDPFAPPKFQTAQKLVYEEYGANIMFEEKDWWHVFPIDYDTGVIAANDCLGGEESIGLPVNNCGYDAAGKILTHLLTNIPATGIDKLAPKELDFEKLGVWRQFKQWEFTDEDIETTGL